MKESSFFDLNIRLYATFHPQRQVPKSRFLYPGQNKKNRCRNKFSFLQVTAEFSQVMFGNVLGPDSDGLLALDVYPEVSSTFSGFYQVFTLNSTGISRCQRGTPTRNLPEHIAKIIKLTISKSLYIPLIAIFTCEFLPSTAVHGINP